MSKDLTLPFDRAQIADIITRHPTPFHLYDEKAIRENARRFYEAFAWSDGFREFFAVKAAPNPHLLNCLREEGCGADCSSLAELILAEKSGISGEAIMFTSNNTSAAEFAAARALGAIINLDDITHIDYLDKHCGLPDVVCCRYNPGPLRGGGNAIIGRPEEAKYGFTREQLFSGYAMLKERGVKRFGLHTMIVSNELNARYLVETARMLFQLAGDLYDEIGIRIEFINLGGGVGIPYRPEENAIDLMQLGADIHAVYYELIEPTELHPLRLCMENGRMMTGPFGYLVMSAIHRKNTYKNYIGVDACMANLMRPGMYDAYHHLTVLGKENEAADQVYDVVGSLCENNDKFAVDRALPTIKTGDVLVVHDTGAHGHAMGFQYNGKLRSAELLLAEDGSVREIRRTETLDDYFCTLDFSSLK